MVLLMMVMILPPEQVQDISYSVLGDFVEEFHENLVVTLELI